MKTISTQLTNSNNNYVRCAVYLPSIVKLFSFNFRINNFIQNKTQQIELRETHTQHYSKYTITISIKIYSRNAGIKMNSLAIRHKISINDSANAAYARYVINLCSMRAMRADIIIFFPAVCKRMPSINTSILIRFDNSYQFIYFFCVVCIGYCRRVFF